MSPNALAALATDSANRYQFSEGENCFYGDTGRLSEIIELCEDLSRRYFDSRHSIVTGLSGLNAMHAVLTAFAQSGEHVFTVDESSGGHYATRTICEKYGIRTSALPYDVDARDFDYDAIGKLALLHRPKAIYLDTSTLITLPSMPALRAAVGAEPVICFDASQVLALVPDNLERVGPSSGLDILNGSTHKTIPGPQKGIAVTNDPDIHSRLLVNLPYYVSNPHINAIGALAITLMELMPCRVEYARSTVHNANALAESLRALGFMTPVGRSGAIETQQVWIEPQGQDALEWARVLRRASIRCTVVPLPSSGGRPGLRLGVQELTRIGMTAADMTEVARLLFQCLHERKCPEIVGDDVRAFVRSFRSLHFISGSRGDDDAAVCRETGEKTS